MRAGKWVLAAVGLVAGLVLTLRADPFYVSPNGNNTPPYTSWATAAHTIQAAVDEAGPGALVLVSNATYTLSAPVLIQKDITVRSAFGAAVTIVDGNNLVRGFVVSNAAAVVDGFTITQGRSATDYNAAALGGGVLMFEGQLVNSRILNSVAQHGAGVYFMGSSVISNCFIMNNTCGSPFAVGQGGGLGNSLHSGGIVANCTVVSNTASAAGIWASAVLMENNILAYNTDPNNFSGGMRQLSGTNRNSLIYRNTVTGPGGGGIYASHGALIESCTVVYNRSLNSGNTARSSGLRAGDTGSEAPTVRNTIVIGNTFEAGGMEVRLLSAAQISYSCQTNWTGSGNINVDPLFYDAATDIFALTSASLCRDAGSNQGWMSTASDVAGLSRLYNTTVDIGAYEYTPPRTLYVAPSGTDGVNDGLTWADAFATIGYAVDRAHAVGDVVIVSNGLYTLSGPVTLSKPVTVRSAHGKGVTFVDGNRTTRAFHVAYKDAEVDGFTVTNGVASPVLAAYGSRARGGGALLAAGRIVNSTFQHNRAQDGGGIYFLGSQSMVSNCLIWANSSTNNGAGGGLANNDNASTGHTGGLITHCTIVSNTALAGGVWIRFGTLQNSVIAYNSDAFNFSGGVRQWGGTNRNCVMVRNTLTGAGGGGIYATDGARIENATVAYNSAGSGNTSRSSGLRAGDDSTVSVINAIVFGNTFESGLAMEVRLATAGQISYSCQTNWTGNGNLNANPQFANVATDDFSLSALSPCRDVGSNDGWMSMATDAADNPRIYDWPPAVVDMGAFEYNPGALDVSFIASATSGLEPLPIVFTASVSGNTNKLGYRWSFEDGGATIDLTGDDVDVVTNVYSFGNYTVALTVTNALLESATYVLPASITPNPAVLYVSPDGGNVAPYETWAKAAHTIQAAVDEALNGALVLVSNATYTLSAPVVVQKAVTVRSESGAAVTTVSGNNLVRGFVVSNVAAVVDGFTITQGRSAADYNAAALGGGVLMFAGHLQNSRILNSVAQHGAGVYFMGSSVISNCFIMNNTCGTPFAVGQGGGLGNSLHSGGIVANCTVVSNTASAGGIWASAVLMENNILAYNTDPNNFSGGMRQLSGTNRNSLIYRNTVTGPGGGGIYASHGALIESGTVAYNRSLNTGNTLRSSGLRAGDTGSEAPTILNTIVSGNTFETGGMEVRLLSAAQISYSCQTNWTGSGNVTAPPLFADVATDNFNLGALSPCRDVGSNQGWMSTATDAANNPRIYDWPPEVVDIGALEYYPGPLSVSFIASATSGVEPLSVVFTASVSGNTNKLGYRWSFEDGGATIDLTGEDVDVVTNAYAFGSYTVALTVTNALAESATYVLPASITPNPAVLYVSPDGGNVAPFETWTKAAHTIQAAVDEAANGALVLVSNATYTLSAPVLVQKAVTVRSESGAAVTTVSGNNLVRGFVVSNVAAVVDGFTITQGRSATDYNAAALGGGVLMFAGHLQNSRILNSVAQHGAGVYFMGNSVISNCFIMNNTCGTPFAVGRGGGLGNSRDNDWHGGGVVANCTVVSNSASAAGMWVFNAMLENNVVAYNTDPNNFSGGMRQWGGTNRNSLIYRNVVTGAGGGGIYASHGALIESGTVAYNRSIGSGNTSRSSGLRAGDDATPLVRNTIVYGNTFEAGAMEVRLSSASQISYSCQTNWTGSGNVTADPVFADVATDDFNLGALSPCRDVGSNQGWMSTATDAANNPRIYDWPPQVVDIGALEYYPGALGVSFTASATTGIEPLEIEFTAMVSGNTNSIYYFWSFEDGGVTVDLQGAAADVVTHTYAYGSYTVALTVTNALGETATYLLPATITPSPSVLYVSPVGGNIAPYETWAKAAHTIQTAVDSALNGALILVSNATYTLSAPVLIQKAVEVRGVYGAAATIVDGDNAVRGFVVSNAAAVVDGFTITQGRSATDYNAAALGGGVLMFAGHLRNSRVLNSVAQHGAGVYFMGDSVISNCFLMNNVSGSPFAVGRGGGLGNSLHSGGVVANCTVVSNSAHAAGMWVQAAMLENNIVAYNTDPLNFSGGIRQLSGTNRNSLIYRNIVTVPGGGGIYASHGALIESATVAHNQSVGSGNTLRSSGLRAGDPDLPGDEPPTVRNTIVFGNTFEAGGMEVRLSSASQISYSIQPDWSGSGNINADPQFSSVAVDNFAVGFSSPSVDNGLDQGWMNTATDVAGKNRLSGTAVDIGAYEWVRPPVTVIFFR